MRIQNIGDVRVLVQTTGERDANYPRMVFGPATTVLDFCQRMHASGMLVAIQIPDGERTGGGWQWSLVEESTRELKAQLAALKPSGEVAITGKLTV